VGPDDTVKKRKKWGKLTGSDSGKSRFSPKEETTVEPRGKCETSLGGGREGTFTEEKNIGEAETGTIATKGVDISGKENY